MGCNPCPSRRPRPRRRLSDATAVFDVDPRSDQPRLAAQSRVRSGGQPTARPRGFIGVSQTRGPISTKSCGALSTRSRREPSSW
jgi:hypothetical protein